VSASTWTGNPAPTLSYQWKRNTSSSAAGACDFSAGGWSNVGTNSTSFTLGDTDGGTDSIGVRITATNGVAPDATRDVCTVYDGIDPPNYDDDAFIDCTGSGGCEDSDAATVDVGDWDGTDPITYTYQWATHPDSNASCNANASYNGTNWTSVGSNSSTYGPPIGNSGSGSDRLRVVITGTNAAGSDTIVVCTTFA
jgi:hypothetical protein